MVTVRYDGVAGIFRRLAGIVDFRLVVPDVVDLFGMVL